MLEGDYAEPLNCAMTSSQQTHCYWPFLLCTGDALLKSVFDVKERKIILLRNNLRMFQWLRCIISKGNCFCAKPVPKVLLIQDVN